MTNEISKHVFIVLQEQIGIINTILFFIVFVLIITSMVILNKLLSFRDVHINEHEGIKKEKDTFRVDIINRVENVSDWLSKLEKEFSSKFNKLISSTNEITVKQAVLETVLTKKEYGKEVISKAIETENVLRN